MAAAPRPAPLPIRVRRATADDRDAVLAFASRTWDGWDYVPEAWPAWLGGSDGVLLVATPQPGGGGPPILDTDGASLDPDVPIAVTHLLMLSDDEVWLEGIRVDPRVRGRSVATSLQIAELAWARAHGARTVRYVTDADNEGSHRLGARHGFRVVGAWRSYGREADPESEDHAQDAQDGAGALEAPDAGGALDALAAAGVRLPPDADPSRVDEWWRRIASDPTLGTGGMLYEGRAWTLQRLTRDRLLAHTRAGEVVAVEDDATDAGWALAIVSRHWLREGELFLGALCGDPGVALRLCAAVAAAVSERVRFRLPDPDPLLLRGSLEAFTEAGFPPRSHLLHLLERPLDPDEPLPEPDVAGLLDLADPPARVATPPR